MSVCDDLYSAAYPVRALDNAAPYRELPLLNYLLPAKGPSKVACGALGRGPVPMVCITLR